MKDRPGSIDCHAYVDGGLTPEQRSAFEAAFRDDPRLRRRVEAWQAQNEAIRVAFGGAPRARAAPGLGRPVNENGGRPARTAEAAVFSETPAAATPRPMPPADQEEPQRNPPRVRLAAAAILAVLVLCAGVWWGPRDPRDALMDAGVAAIRAFAAPSSAPLDLATDDVRALKAWLAPRFPGAPLGGVAAAPGAWRLVGARIVPGAASAAVLILYEKEGSPRAGLMFEPLDAPPALRAIARERAGGAAVAARTQGGYGIAAMGPDVEIVQRLMAPWRRPD